MAKEMMIVFVYDTIRCLAEADDPADAVLYFHPGWVSDTQRIALCGQLMGVTHCLKALFSTPKILTLHSGKFIIEEYGRLVLAIGSDRNIPDWMLKNRAAILTSLIKVYHCDLQTISDQFPGENNPRFSEKLYQMFETYLPILQFGGHMFKNVPLLNLPKSASSVFLEGVQVLDYCVRSKGVLGGSILFNNKIVATQLSPKLTSRLAMVDPHHIKSPAETVDVNYDLPSATQLLIIYVKKGYLESLKKDANRLRVWHESGFDKVKMTKNVKPIIKEMSLGSMKRDKSLLFTAVPEEDIGTNSPSPNSPELTKSYAMTTLKQNLESKLPIMPDVVPFSNKPRIRPNKLSLSFKNSISKDSIEENVAENKCEPVFTGQTSVCSTPMLEFKPLHGKNVLSICRPANEQFSNEDLYPTYKPAAISPSNILTETNEELKDSPNDIPKNSPSKKPCKDFTTTEQFISLPADKFRKFHSLTDINSGFKRISQLAAMRFGKKGLTKNPNKTMSLNADDSPDDNDEKQVSVTISDPHYPVFRNDGVPISKSLFDEYLCQHYPNKIDKCEEALKNISNFDSNLPNAEQFEGFDSETSNTAEITSQIESPSISTKPNPELESFEKPDPSRRKSLTLPIKSLGIEKNITSESSLQNQPTSLYETHRKKLSGVQLTPLMEKLSHLAFSEKSSGYSSRGITPMEFKDFALSTPCLEKTVTFPTDNKSPKKTISFASDADSDSDDEGDASSFSVDCAKCCLFVCGLQNTSLFFIMEESAAKDKETIQHLWETSMKSLTTIEQMCMEPLPSGDETTESYSFLSLDPQWGTVKKGGPWASNDIATMGYIHKYFKDDPSLSEIIIRSEDSLVFGTICGGSETYYQESGIKQPGLPTSADLMGTAPLKSKRRLQRDHSITIF